MFSRKLTCITITAVVALFSNTIQAGRIVWPCSGSVTSPYGPRSSPCSGCSTFHHGIDIGVGSGTILGSPGNGSITSYAYDSCAGNLMKIGYGGGWETRFLHTSSAILGVGSGVTRNVDVARSGNTGSCTTGAHLHFEVRKDGASQVVPGSAGNWVTRGNEVPSDYPGLNDAPPPPPPFVRTTDQSVLVRPDGRIAVFALGVGGYVFITWQNVVGGGYVPWVNLGGGSLSKIQALYNPVNGCFTVMGLVGSASQLFQISQVTAGGSWSSWVPVAPGPLSDFDAMVLPDGKLFAAGVSGSTICWNKQSTWNTNWDGSASWAGLGGTGFSQVKLFQEADARITIFAIGPGSPMWSISQVTPGSTSWTGWSNFGGILTDFDVIKMGTGHPMVFAVSGASVWRNFRYPLNGSTQWTGWGSIGGSGMGMVKAVNNPVYGPVVYGIGGLGVVWMQWMNYPGDTWSGWYGLAGNFSNFEGNATPNGVNVLFGRDKNGHIYGNGQSAPQGSWQGWFDMGQAFI